MHTIDSIALIYVTNLINRRTGTLNKRVKPDQLVVLIQESKAKEERREEEGRRPLYTESDHVQGPGTGPFRAVTVGIGRAIRDTTTTVVPQGIEPTAEYMVTLRLKNRFNLFVVE